MKEYSIFAGADEIKVPGQFKERHYLNMYLGTHELNITRVAVAKRKFWVREFTVIRSTNPELKPGAALHDLVNMEPDEEWQRERVLLAARRFVAAARNLPTTDVREVDLNLATGEDSNIVGSKVTAIVAKKENAETGATFPDISFRSSTAA